jgi:hypothetical protein
MDGSEVQLDQSFAVRSDNALNIVELFYILGLGRRISVGILVEEDTLIDFAEGT